MEMTTRFGGVTVVRKQPCLMRDGTILYADIYRPEAVEDLPVLLMRQPYGKAIASTVSHAHPVWYARHGYIVVIQDVRGKWDSEGEYIPFIQDADDGYDTVEWAAQLPGSNGRVGMYGFSYQGSTQWAAASAAPPHLKAIAPAMCASDLYHGMFYPHGRLLLREHLPWAYQLARDNARRAGDEEAEQQCAMIMRNPEAKFWELPIGSADNHPLLERYFPQYREWCEHPEYDEYWMERDWLAKIKKQASLIPALHIGGWYDVFLMGTIQSYEQLKQLPGGDTHRLVVGPWTHLPWGRKAGGFDHGEQADGDIHYEQLRWFDYWLKGQGELSPEDEAIRYYEFGSQKWRSLGQESLHDRARWSLASGDKPANGALGGGKLICDKTGAVSGSGSQQPEIFVYDARQPMRLDAYAPVDRSADQDRYEMLVYTSEPLTENLYVFGTPSVTAHCQTIDGPTDLVAMLTIVSADGSARLMSVGRNEVLGANDAAGVEVKIEMKPCAVHFSPGSQIRLELTGSAFPLFTRHPNGQGAQAHNATAGSMNIATVAVYSEEGQVSYLELPIYGQGR